MSWYLVRGATYADGSVIIHLALVRESCVEDSSEGPWRRVKEHTHAPEPRQLEGPERPIVAAPPGRPQSCHGTQERGSGGRPRPVGGRRGWGAVQPSQEG